jgi:hypothetical protein
MSFQPGQVIRFKNPEDGKPNVGQFLGIEGGELKIQNRDGIVYVYLSDVISGGKRNSRKNRRNNRKISRRNNRKSRRNN